jgi:hypothetical protein
MQTRSNPTINLGLVRPNRACCAALILTSIIAATTASAQLPWRAAESGVAGGGLARSEGGGFTLHGMVGQPAPATSYAGDWTLAGGFWDVTPLPDDGVAPELDIALVGPDAALISWSASTTSGFQLQEAVALAPAASWEPVTAQPSLIGGSYVVLVSLTQAQRYYRLQRTE